MKQFAVATYLSFAFVTFDCSASPDIHAIGKKIWDFECAGSIQGLTTWNKGENFASFGIGHFIWYSAKHADEPFDETFPTLLRYIESQGQALPLSLKNAKRCPWQSRDEFYAKVDSQEMQEIRDFLAKTVKLQAQFIIKRFDDSLSKITAEVSAKERNHLTTIFNRLKDTSNGLFAMIDYVNFKGLGTSLKERYKGQGWGLRQVLLRVPLSTDNPLLSFVESAKEVLKERIKNSGKEEIESKWLLGWMKRVDSYSI